MDVVRIKPNEPLLLVQVVVVVLFFYFITNDFVGFMLAMCLGAVLYLVQYLIYYEEIELTDDGMLIKRVGRQMFIKTGDFYGAKRTFVFFSVHLSHRKGMLRIMRTGNYRKADINTVTDWVRSHGGTSWPPGLK